MVNRVVVEGGGGGGPRLLPAVQFRMGDVDVVVVVVEE
jgi:2-phospho-L-lactate transferase/gluconeogenesis factor (CofD/UPF0052 family)